MAVRVVTDSTADIPQEKAQALGITIIPLSVFFGAFDDSSAALEAQVFLATLAITAW